MDYVLGLPVKISLSLIFCGIEFLAAKEESDNQNHSKPIILVVIPRVFATDFGADGFVEVLFAFFCADAVGGTPETASGAW